MYHTTPVLLHQYTVFQIWIYFKYKSHGNTSKKDRKILWYNTTINNIYPYGSDIKSIYHHSNNRYVLDGRSVKPLKEGLWEIQYIMIFLRNLVYQKSLYD